MIKTKKKQNNLSYWLTIGLISQLITSPNVSIMKVILASLDPTTFNFLRAGVCVIVATPFVVWHWRKLRRTNVVYAIGAGICTAISMTVFTYAIQQSQASYVVIMSMLAPVMLVVLSRFFFQERIRLRAAAGVTLAALGALAAVALPLIIGGKTIFAWYPLATALSLLGCIFLPLATIFLRKSNEAGLPLTSTQGISATVVMIISFTATYAINGTPVNFATIPVQAWLGIVYCAVIVVFIARVLNTASFERIGAAATSSLNYLGIVVALVIPITFLHETVSSATLIGGGIILIGVYLTEQHRKRHLRHQHLLRHL